MMQKTCSNGWCNQQFTVDDIDLEFYDKVSPVLAGKKYLIPAPTMCPDCRDQRRMSWRGEHSLYNRACDLCKKSMVSIHSPDSRFPVYCVKCWWSDDWDPASFAKEVDSSKSFFEQFKELHNSVPQITMMNDNGIGSENCEYCHDFAFGKNCYLVTGAWKLEDCYYCDHNTVRSRMLVDCDLVHGSELVYESASSIELNRCAFMYHSDNCHDCTFGLDMKGCSDCVACAGLRQKKFCIFNQQYSEDEYRKRVAEMNLHTHTGLRVLQKQFDKWVVEIPRRAVYLVNCENCTGNELSYSKDAFECYQFAGAEFSKYCITGDVVKNCMDMSCTGAPEWCLEGATPDNSYMTHFTTWCWKNKYLLYSDNCHNCEHCFGCIGLKRKKYCIFNKQYSKEDYERVVGSFIEGMTAHGEWGQFFPTLLSPFAYNETNAYYNHPLTQQQIEERGWRWKDSKQKTFQQQTVVLSDSIDDIQDSIENELLACELCNKNYKILSQELQFYREMCLPVPRQCYDCRYADRITRRSPRRLWSRNCMKCSSPIQTTYAPDRPEIVYCEKCYLETIY